MNYCMFKLPGIEKYGSIYAFGATEVAGTPYILNMFDL